MYTFEITSAIMANQVRNYRTWPVLQCSIQNYQKTGTEYQYRQKHQNGDNWQMQCTVKHKTRNEKLKKVKEFIYLETMIILDGSRQLWYRNGKAYKFWYSSWDSIKSGKTNTLQFKDQSIHRFHHIGILVWSRTLHPQYAESKHRILAADMKWLTKLPSM